MNSGGTFSSRGPINRQIAQKWALERLRGGQVQGCRGLRICRKLAERMACLEFAARARMITREREDESRSGNQLAARWLQEIYYRNHIEARVKVTIGEHFWCNRLIRDTSRDNSFFRNARRNGCYELTVDVARRLLSCSPIGRWSYEAIRARNGLSYVNKSREPKARLRLICEVIAIFTRTIRNSQRPSIIIIYRRSPNSYRAYTHVAPREGRACESASAYTHSHADRRPNPFRFITALLSRGSEALLPDPALNYDWTRYIDPRRSWFEASRSARVNASPDLFSPSSIALTISPRIGLWPFREQNRNIREGMRDALRSVGWSVDRSIDRALDEPRHLRTPRGRNASARKPRYPKDPLAISQRSCPSTCQRRNNASSENRNRFLRFPFMTPSFLGLCSRYSSRDACQRAANSATRVA